MNKKKYKRKLEKEYVIKEGIFIFEGFFFCYVYI